MTYGCGSITNGTQKVTIQICNFTPLNIEKGVSVSVIGEIKNIGSGMYNLLYINYYTNKIKN